MSGLLRQARFVQANFARTSLNKGQSFIEIVFAVLVVVMSLTGVVILVGKTLNSKTRMFDQKKATELGQVVIERLIGIRETQPDQFWDLTSPYWVQNNGTTQIDANFQNYYYIVTVTQQTTGGCSANPVNCANAVVKVGWSGSSSYEVKFSRFFTRR